VAENDSLTARQRRFVAALLTARTVEAAAKTAGISERTAYRYLRLDQVRQALAQALDDLLAGTTRRGVSAMGEALETLTAIHKNRRLSAAARVSAARTLLTVGPVLYEVHGLAERLERLEKAAGGKDGKQS
jgi:phage terminase small subunit